MRVFASDGPHRDPRSAAFADMAMVATPRGARTIVSITTLTPGLGGGGAAPSDLTEQSIHVPEGNGDAPSGPNKVNDAARVAMATSSDEAII